MKKKVSVIIGSDHAGFLLKENLKEYLKQKGFDVIDSGTDSEESCDYPDYAKEVAGCVSEGKCRIGLLVCGTGIGMSMTANRFPKVRAALVSSNFQAEMAKKHNNANVLVFGSRTTGPTEARIMLDKWLNAKFEGGRHLRRVKKIDRT